MTGHDAAVRRLAIPGLLVAALTLSSCGMFDGLFEGQPDPQPRSSTAADVVGNYARARRARPNVHAWQAARETLTFMRLRTSDYYGGVLATDWFRPKASPNERLRVTVAIMATELDPRTVRVSVIKQRRSRGAWRDVPVSKATVSAIHSRIYTRAQQLKAQAVR
jgi:hypothetical protein